MKVQISSKSTVGYLLLPVLLLVGWCLLTADAIVSAMKIWYVSEIFNHCFFVLPISIYLIWSKRNKVDWPNAKPIFLPIPIIVSQLIVFSVGVAGDIQVFQHIATFSLLPTMFWLLVGHKIAKQLAFPLLFILFSIPIGEELIPTLQEVTADISVAMLRLTGIPLFRSGLFIEIPQGRFLVAEACSGISFLIASFVVGNLFAYMNLTMTKTKLVFVALSLAVPILANAIRVFGIIVIGYSTDMEHAVGADHLIYGWFFFAFVIVCLLFIGELLRKYEKRFITTKFEDDLIDDEEQKSLPLPLPYRSAFPVVAVIVSFIIVNYLLSTREDISSERTTLNITLPFDSGDNATNESQWEPQFEGASDNLRRSYRKGDLIFDVYVGFYANQDGELISSQNRIYSGDSWTLVSAETVSLSGNYNINRHIVSSPDAKIRSILFAYIINNRLFTDKYYAKLYQVWMSLSGDSDEGAVIAIAIDDKDYHSLMEQGITSDILDSVKRSMDH